MEAYLAVTPTYVSCNPCSLFSLLLSQIWIHLSYAVTVLFNWCFDLVQLTPN